MDALIPKENKLQFFRPCDVGRGTARAALVSCAGRVAEEKSDEKGKKFPRDSIKSTAIRAHARTRVPH